MYANTIIWHNPQDCRVYRRKPFSSGEWCCSLPVIDHCTYGGLGGWPPSLEWKSALNFNPWAKFQTFRQLTPSSFRSVPTLHMHSEPNGGAGNWTMPLAPGPLHTRTNCHPTMTVFKSVINYSVIELKPSTQWTSPPRPLREALFPKPWSITAPPTPLTFDQAT